MQRVIYRLKLFIFYAFVVVVLLLNKALIRVVPFKKLIELYANSPIGSEYYEVEKSNVRLIHNALARFQKILFWKPVCFEQCLTVMVLARLFCMSGTVYFGIKKTQQGEILAHAWSQIGNCWITGYTNKDEFTVVYKMHYIPVERKCSYGKKW